LNRSLEPATFTFLPAGLSFGVLFFLPWMDASISFWPYFAMLFAVVVTASMISIIKLNNGKYIFEHFSYLLVASVLFIVGGTLLSLLQAERESTTIVIVSLSESDSPRLFSDRECHLECRFMANIVE